MTVLKNVFFKLQTGSFCSSYWSVSSDWVTEMQIHPNYCLLSGARIYQQCRGRFENPPTTSWSTANNHTNPHKCDCSLISEGKVWIVLEKFAWFFHYSQLIMCPPHSQRTVEALAQYIHYNLHNTHTSLHMFSVISVNPCLCLSPSTQH